MTRAARAAIWCSGLTCLLACHTAHADEGTLNKRAGELEWDDGLQNIGRARPSYEDCQRDPSIDRLCRSGVRSSFPSGHVNGSFASAGLACAHHLHLALYGNTFADTLACAGMIALATSTSALRVMGDRHYPTVVWTGAAIGFAFGYGMPTLFHYGKAGSGAEASLVVSPVGAGFPFGPTISGTF